MSSNIFFAHVGLELGAEALPRVRAALWLLRADDDRALRIAPLPVAASFVTAGGRRRLRAVRRTTPSWPAPPSARAPTAVTPVQMALAGGGDRRRRGHAAPLRRARRARACRGRRAAASRVLETFSSGGGTRVVSAEAAAADARRDGRRGERRARPPLRRRRRDVTLYGIGNERSAGKTGTAQLGGEQAPHSWFIGFAPAAGSARRPRSPIAVIVESGGSGAGTRGADRRPRHGRVAAASGRWRRLNGIPSEPVRNALGYCMRREPPTRRSAQTEGDTE